MRGNKWWLGGLAVIGVAVIGYFAFFYPPAKQESQEMLGTIGAVEKYRADQIAEQDVTVAGAEGAAGAAGAEVTPDILADILERASVQEKAALFERANVQERADL